MSLTRLDTIEAIKNFDYVLDRLVEIFGEGSRDELLKVLDEWQAVLTRSVTPKKKEVDVSLKALMNDIVAFIKARGRPVTSETIVD